MCAAGGARCLADLGGLHHRLRVDRLLGALHLRADLPLRASWTLLFGPSGSGKTSLLRAACGLLGRDGVHFSRCEPPGPDVTLISPQGSQPLHQLGLGYAPQQGALFPHLSVVDNLAFGLTARGERVSRSPVINDLLELFDLAPLRDRTPRMLSGGERQRVNLARAFAVPSARLLLLDEPFSGVSRGMRDRLLGRMLVWAQERTVPILSVSHDVDEALLLGAEVVVLEEGQILRRGPAAETLAAERQRLLAVLNGTNLSSSQP